MDKVAESIEELDLQMYQIIFSKSKLDDIVEKLEKLDPEWLNSPVACFNQNCSS